MVRVSTTKSPYHQHVTEGVHLGDDPSGTRASLVLGRQSYVDQYHYQRADEQRRTGEYGVKNVTTEHNVRRTTLEVSPAEDKSQTHNNQRYATNDNGRNHVFFLRVNSDTTKLQLAAVYIYIFAINPL